MQSSGSVFVTTLFKSKADGKGELLFFTSGASLLEYKRSKC